MDDSMDLAERESLHSHSNDPARQQQDDLWRRAYEGLLADDHRLVDVYKLLLQKELGVTSNDSSIQQRASMIITFKLNQIQKKQWRLQWGHKSIKIRSQVDRVVKLVEAFKNVGNVASNAAPIHAGLPWAGVCLLLVPILHDSQQSAALMMALATTTDIIARHQLTRLPSSALSSTQQSRSEDVIDDDSGVYMIGAKIFDSVVKLYKSILQFQMKTASFLSKNTLLRIARNVPKSDDWTAILSTITHLDAECGHYQALHQSTNSTRSLGRVLQVVQDNSKRLEEILVSMDHRDQSAYRLAASLSSVNVGQDHADARNRLGSRYWNSGQWLLNRRDYIDWSKSGAGVLWLRGLVGSGKTSLASIVIQQTLANVSDHHVAFFYCSQQDRETAGDSLRYGACEPADVLRSLLAQILSDDDAKTCEPLRTWLEKNFAPNMSGGIPKARYPLNRLISMAECVESLIETIRMQGPAILLIDALDECHNPYELLDSLETIQSECPEVRLFMTSRLSVQNDLNFVNATMISSFSSSIDIDTFIMRETTLPERTIRSGMTPGQMETFQTLLARHANGMFRWVELQIDVVLNKTYPLRHPKDVRTAINKIRHISGHPSLNSVYEDVFKLNTQGQKHSRYLAIKALNWMLCCLKPMTLDGLVEAVALDLDGHRDTVVDRSFVMQICSNFIRVAESGTVRLAHRSVKEYLARSKASNKTDRHFQAAETCLGVLYGLGDADYLEELLLDPQAEAQHIQLSDFQMYACLLWSSHCEKVFIAGVVKSLRQPLVRLIGRLLIPQVEGATTSRSYQKWNNLLWRVFHTEYEIDEQLRQRLEDAISLPANPLLAACVWGLTEHVPMLLGHDAAYARQANCRGKTPLFLASERGNVEMIELLAAQSGNLDVLHPVWGSCLQAAAWSGSLRSFAYLLSNGFDLNAGPGCYGRVLDAAIAGGNEMVVLTALQQRAEVWMPSITLHLPSLGRSPTAFLASKQSSMSSLTSTFEQCASESTNSLEMKDPKMQHHWIDGTFLGRLRRAKSRQRQITACRITYVNSLPLPSSPQASFACVRPALRHLPQPTVLRSFASEASDDPSYCMSRLWFKFFGEVSFHETCCFTQRTLKSRFRSNWRTHVLRDLWPYICPFNDCSSSERLYATHEEWTLHISASHEMKLLPLAPATRLFCSSDSIASNTIKPADCLDRIMSRFEAEVLGLLSQLSGQIEASVASVKTRKTPNSGDVDHHPQIQVVDESEELSSSSDEHSIAITGWSLFSSHGSDSKSIHQGPSSSPPVRDRPEQFLRAVAPKSANKVPENEEFYVASVLEEDYSGNVDRQYNGNDDNKTPGSSGKMNAIWTSLVEALPMRAKVSKETSLLNVSSHKDTMSRDQRERARVILAGLLISDSGNHASAP